MSTQSSKTGVNDKDWGLVPPGTHICTHDSVQTDHGLNIVYCCYCGAYYGNAWEFDEEAPLAPQKIALPQWNPVLRKYEV
jgi:hypothetical protein